MTACRECEAAGVDHDAIVERARRSPLDAGIVLGGMTFLDTDFHWAVNDWFMSKLDAGKRRFIIMWARNHGKTMYAVCIMLWRMACDPNDRILYRMASSKNAEKTLKVVTQTLALSKTLEHFYPHLKLYSGDASRWTSNAAVLEIPRSKQLREPTIEARSTTSLVTGAHANWLINDDLIDEVAVYSDLLQSKAVNIIKNSDSMMADQGIDKEIIIGTMWAGGFYDWLLDPEGIASEYETVVLGARHDERSEEFFNSIGKKTTLKFGDPIWPEKFTKETLDGIERKDKWHFQSQWMNYKLTEEGQRFLREDFRYYNLDGAREVISVEVGGKVTNYRVSNLHRVLMVDPATGDSSRTDQSALVVTGYDKDTGRVFVLDTWDGKPLPRPLIEKMLDMAEKWDVKAILIEDVAFQKTLKWFVKETMVKRGRHFNIKPVKPGNKSKGARILDSLQPFISNHQVYFQRGQRRITQELESIQIVDGKIIGRSPNLADALSYGVETWRGFSPFQDRSDGIDYVDSVPQEVRPAYGLACQT